MYPWDPFFLYFWQFLNVCWIVPDKQFWTKERERRRQAQIFALISYVDNGHVKNNFVYNLPPLFYWRTLHMFSKSGWASEFGDIIEKRVCKVR